MGSLEGELWIFLGNFRKIEGSVAFRQSICVHTGGKRDFHGANCHFTEDNEIAHFDFDLCSYSWRAYDLAIYRWSTGRADHLWQAFPEGYQSVRPLSPTEREAVPTFVVMRQIWLMGSHTTYPDARSWLRQNHWDRMFERLEECLQCTL